MFVSSRSFSPPRRPQAPIPRDAKWLMGGVIGIARHAFRIERVPDEVRDARLSLCVVCPDFRPKGSKDGIPTGSCRLCGCGVRAKASDAKSRCPAGKWLEWKQEVR